MTEFTNLSLIQDPVTLQRKLSCLCFRYCSLGHYPQFLLIGESRYVERVSPFCSTLFSQQINPHRCRRHTDLPANLPVHSSLTGEEDSSTRGSTSPLTGRGHSTIFQLRTVVFRFEGVNSHPHFFTLAWKPVSAESSCFKPHHPQKAKTKPWHHRNRALPPLGCS